MATTIDIGLTAVIETDSDGASDAIMTWGHDKTAAPRPQPLKKTTQMRMVCHRTPLLCPRLV